MSFILPNSVQVSEEDIKKYENLGKYPTLYAFNKNKTKTLIWKIKVEETDEGYGIITREHGQEDGKKIIKKDEITKGKNIGKKNETSPYQQALSEASSYFKKQIKKKYFLNKNEIEDKIKISPMLAYKYEDKKKYVKWPALVQRKFDGVRCIARKDKNGDIIMYKKSMDLISNVLFKQIRKELSNILVGKFKDVWLDGEIYKHGISLQKINIIGKKEIKKSEIEFIEDLEYHVFDCFILNEMNLDFVNRFNITHNIISNKNLLKVKLVATFKINEEKEIKGKLYKFAIDEGYEGIVIRNASGLYKFGVRSNDLFKYKPQDVDEFIIYDVNKVPGDDQFRITFDLLLVSGKIFSVNGNGAESYRKQIYENKKDIIGKYIRILYFDKTEDNIPKFAYPEKDKEGHYIILSEKL